PNFLHCLWQPFRTHSVLDANFDEFESPMTKLRKKSFNPLRFGNHECYRLDSCRIESLYAHPSSDVNCEHRSKIQGRSEIAFTSLLNSFDSHQIERNFETELRFRRMAGVC